MLTLTKRTDYALIAMAYLAGRPGQSCSARQISREFSMSLPVLMNILKTLHNHGLLISSRGPKGGYRIAADPANLSLAKLIHAVEGPVRFVQCIGKDGRPAKCELTGECPIRGPVMRLHEKLNGFLESATLADLIEPGRNELAASPAQ